MFIVYALIGLLGGLVSGLFGVGGGIVLIPCLLLVFQLSGFPSVYMMQLAIGTALPVMVFTTLSAAISHKNKGAVLGDILKKMGWGIILGAFIGAFLGHIFPSVILQILFGLILIVFGVNFYRNDQMLPTRWLNPILKSWKLAAFVIAAISSFLGLGGGIFTVPFLTHQRVPIKKAIGTASVVSCMIAFVASLGYLLFGFTETYYRATLGYTYLPAFLFLTPFGIVGAVLGARLTHRLKSQKLKRIFSIVLVLFGLFMFFK